MLEEERRKNKVIMEMEGGPSPEARARIKAQGSDTIVAKRGTKSSTL